MSEIYDFLKNSRAHAGYFTNTKNKDFSECMVLDYFVKALESSDILFFQHHKHRGVNNDPPDCEAYYKDGCRIGIEIVELVDQYSAESAALFIKEGQHKLEGVHKLETIERRYEWKDWTEELIPAIQNILNNKNLRLLKAKGGPYVDHILLIHSDEPWLELDFVYKCIATHVFDPVPLIARAFFVMPPRPPENHYSCFELRFFQSTCP